MPTDSTKAIYENRELTAQQAKDQLQLQASASSASRYIKRFGWRKIKTGEKYQNKILSM